MTRIRVIYARFCQYLTCDQALSLFFFFKKTKKNKKRKERAPDRR